MIFFYTNAVTMPYLFLQYRLNFVYLQGLVDILDVFFELFD